jgi:hypothetical protein
MDGVTFIDTRNLEGFRGRSGYVGLYFKRVIRPADRNAWHTDGKVLK